MLHASFRRRIWEQAYATPEIRRKGIKLMTQNTSEPLWFRGVFVIMPLPAARDGSVGAEMRACMLDVIDQT